MLASDCHDVAVVVVLASDRHDVAMAVAEVLAFGWASFMDAGFRLSLKLSIPDKIALVLLSLGLQAHSVCSESH